MPLNNGFRNCPAVNKSLSGSLNIVQCDCPFFSAHEQYRRLNITQYDCLSSLFRFWTIDPISWFPLVILHKKRVYVILLCVQCDCAFRSNSLSIVWISFQKDSWFYLASRRILLPLSNTIYYSIIQQEWSYWLFYWVQALMVLVCLNCFRSCLFELRFPI